MISDGRSKCHTAMCTSKLFVGGHEATLHCSGHLLQANELVLIQLAGIQLAEGGQHIRRHGAGIALHMRQDGPFRVAAGSCSAQLGLALAAVLDGIAVLLHTLGQRGRGVLLLGAGGGGLQLGALLRGVVKVGELVLCRWAVTESA